MDWIKSFKSNEYLLKDASLRLVLLETKRKCLPIELIWICGDPTSIKLIVMVRLWLPSCLMIKAKHLGLFCPKQINMKLEKANKRRKILVLLLLHI